MRSDRLPLATTHWAQVAPLVAAKKWLLRGGTWASERLTLSGRIEEGAGKKVNANENARTLWRRRLRSSTRVRAACGRGEFVCACARGSAHRAPACVYSTYEHVSVCVRCARVGSDHQQQQQQQFLQCQTTAKQHSNHQAPRIVKCTAGLLALFYYFIFHELKLLKLIIIQI